MNLTCPKCRHEFIADEVRKCPECGWDLETEFAKTVIPSTSDPKQFASGETTREYAKQQQEFETDQEAEFQIDDEPVPELPTDSPATDTAPTMEIPTIEPPQLTPQADGKKTRPDASRQTSRSIEPTVDLDAMRESMKTQAGTDAYMMQTLPSVGHPQNEPTDSDTTVSPRAVPTAERSINSIIPKRSLSRKFEAGKLQDYKLEKQLGSGSFGVVFRALQVPLDRTVAIKVLTSGDSADEQQRDKLQNEFLREAQFTGRLEHPNIVPIHDIGLTLDRRGKLERPFYVMKEIHGTSWLQTIARLSRSENLEIFKKVVDAIGFAHDKHVLHCDLKPENIMLGQFGEVLVVDWGQAVDLNQPATIRPGGTPAYISPEMATYWCDLYLDKKLTSPAMTKIGPHSDVYLLGGLLFEIITNKLPRNAKDNETQYEVIQRARTNDIVDHDEFLDDELMQIARRALRLTESDPIETVRQLQEAVRQYEHRALSYELRERADQLLSQAQSNQDYDDYQKARFGYEEALEKWDANAAARDGLAKARLSCAELALAEQNFDLGIKLLEQPESESEQALKQQLVLGKAKRDRRKKLVRHLALGLAASILVGIGLNAVMINLNLRTQKLANDANIAKSKIEQEIGQLKTEMADFQQQIVAFPDKLRQKQEEFDRDLAAQKQSFQTDLQNEQVKLAAKLLEAEQQFDEKLKLKNEEFASQLAAETNQFERKSMQLSNQLAVEKAKFEREQRQFDNQRSEFKSEIGDLANEVTTLSESSKLLRFKTTITSILQKLQAGNFRESRELIDAAENKTAWEWGRLNLLAHREVQSDYPQQDLILACASHTGQHLGLVFSDHVEIRNTDDITVPQTIVPVKNATAAALSVDGTLLALGLPGGSRQSIGTIELVNLSDAANPQPLATLNAQSTSIDHLEFSASGRLLSVGTPSKLRKSSEGLEEELMVWSKAGQRMEVDLADDRGALPKFTWATFCFNGNKILTTNPDGLGREQWVHVLSESENGFRCTQRSPIAGLNCATFSDDAGAVVIANSRDSATGAYSIVRWNLPPTSDPEDATTPSDLITTVAQVEQKILTMNRSGDWLVTGGEDREITLWNWTNQTSTRFPGHSHDVNFCSMILSRAGDHVLISASAGAVPEIMKIDLSTYQPEIQSKLISRAALDDKPSPTSVFVSDDTGVQAFGNDQGQVSVWLPALENNSEGGTIQWEASAWKNHYLTDRFLFAQSRRDHFYQYDRRSGVLLKVLTQLAKSGPGADQREEITSVDISTDGSLAVITADNQRPEFEIWNLQTQTKLHTINYGDEKIFGTETDKPLSLIKISPDGRWVIGGKVGLFVWSTQTGQPLKLRRNPGEAPRSSISGVRFLRGSAQVVASWKQRIDLVDLNSGTSRIFSVPSLVYTKNDRSLIDCKTFDDRALLLIRTIANPDSKAGIGLLDLKANRMIDSFPGATVARFSRFEPGKLFYVIENDDRSSIFQYDLQSRTTEIVRFQWDPEFENRFRTITQVDQGTDGNITLQSVTPNRVNLARPNRNTLSFNSDRQPDSLRVFAKPKIEYAAVAGTVAITLDSKVLKFWNVDRNGVTPLGHFSQICELCKLSPDQSLLAIAVEHENSLMMVDPQSRAVVARLENPDLTRITGLAWSADSQTLAIGRSNGAVDLWGRVGNKDFKQLPGLPPADQPATEVALSENGFTILAVLPQSGVARISHRSGASWQSFRIQHEDGQPIVTADLSRRGDRAVTGSANGRLTIWNTEIQNERPNQVSPTEDTSSDRELMDLQKQHQSRIRFVRFVDFTDQPTELISAEENAGNNSCLIWKIRPATE